MVKYDIAGFVIDSYVNPHLLRSNFEEYQILNGESNVILKERYCVFKDTLEHVYIDEYRDYSVAEEKEFYIFKKNIYVKAVELEYGREKAVITIYRVQEVPLINIAKTEITYAFRDAYYLFLNRKNVFCFHSCGISIDQYGVLISGKSGSGKTTLSKEIMNEKHCLIGEDVNACMLKNDKLIMCGMPWCRMNNNVCCEINAIVFIKNNTDYSMERMSRQDIERELCDSEFALQWSDAGKACISNILDYIYRRVKCVTFVNEKTDQSKECFKEIIRELTEK